MPLFRHRDYLPTRQTVRPEGQSTPTPPPHRTVSEGSGAGAQDGVSAEDFHALQDELQNERRLRIEAERRLAERPSPKAAPSTPDSFLVSDDDIVKRVRCLRKDIQTWSSNFTLDRSKLNKMIDTNTVPKWVTRMIYPEEDRERKLSSLDQDGMRILYQAVLWDQILIKIFGRHVWAGGSCLRTEAEGKRCKAYDFLREYEPHFKKVYRTRYREGATHAASEAFFKWRCQSSRLVVPIAHHDCSRKNIEQRLADIQEFFERAGFHDTVKRGTWADEKAGDNVAPVSLRKIVFNAGTIDAILCVQTDYYSFTGMFKDKAIALNPGWMDAHDGSKSRINCEPTQVQCIMLTRAPALFKGFTKKYPLLTAIVELGTTLAPRQPGGGPGDDDPD